MLARLKRARLLEAWVRCLGGLVCVVDRVSPSMLRIGIQSSNASAAVDFEDAWSSRSWMIAFR